MFFSRCKNRRLQCYDSWKKNIFDQPVKSYLRKFGNIQKIVTGQGDGYTNSCLLDYPYFKKAL